MKKKQEAENYLDFVPMHSQGISFDQNEEKIVTIYKENKGLFNKIAQVIFHRPKVSQIHLDEMGSYSWTQMDGQASIYDICMKAKAEFGEAAEPLYERMVKYFKILESYEFIEFK